MATFLKTRISNGDTDLIPSKVNSAIGEIQAVLNRIGVTRFKVSTPTVDYFRYDNRTGKLYLETVEGDTKEVTLI